MGVFKGTEGDLFMVRCPKCERENYSPAVSSGICAWCGYVATEEDVNSIPDNIPEEVLNVT